LNLTVYNTTLFII